MFDFQNKEKIAKSLKDRGFTDRIDTDQILIKPKASAQKGNSKLGAPIQAKHVLITEEEKEREITDFEKDCLARFDQNDAEIDEMLDLVIVQLDRIMLHA